MLFPDESVRVTYGQDFDLNGEITMAKLVASEAFSKVKMIPVLDYVNDKTFNKTYSNFASASMKARDEHDKGKDVA